LNTEKKDVQWQEIWAQKSFLQKALSKVREKYNHYFLSFLGSNLSEKEFLEIGSGSGSFTIETAKYTKKSIGIDLSENAIRLSSITALKSNSKATFHQADCFNLPFKDNSFDIIWSQGCIQLIPNPGLCLKEQLRVCKKNGEIIATVPAKYSYLWIWRKVTFFYLLGFLWLWPDHEFYSKCSLEYLGKKVSKNISVSSAGWLRELLVLKIKK